MSSSIVVGVVAWILISWAMYYAITKHVVKIKTKTEKIASIIFTLITGPLMMVGLITALMLGRFVQ